MSLKPILLCCLVGVALISVASMARELSEEEMQDASNGGGSAGGSGVTGWRIGENCCYATGGFCEPFRAADTVGDEGVQGADTTNNWVDCGIYHASGN